jgi:lysophospholipase L1-like esterase
MHQAHNVFDVLTALVLLFSASMLLVGVGRRAATWGSPRHALIAAVRAGLRTARRLVRLAHPAQVVRAVSYATLCTLIILPLTEVGLRAYFRRWGSEQDRIRYVYSETHIKALETQFIGKPFLGFAPSPGFAGHNSMGYRGPEIVRPKPEGTFRIVALGGSTTYGFGLKNEDEPWPAQLQRILRDKYGYTQVEVVNAGVQSYSTWETLVNFEFRVLDLDPDLVIVYHATNDITARLVDPHYYDGLYSARGLWNTGTLRLGPSTLARYVGIKLGQMADPVKLESTFVFDEDVPHCDMWTETECEGYPVEELMELNPPIYFERNLRSLAAIAQANGVTVLFSTWAYFPDTVSITNIYSFPWRRAEAARMNAIIQQVAQDTGSPCYDLAANLAYDRSYWQGDGYHQSALGSEEQARQYAAFIAAQGLVK